MKWGHIPLSIRNDVNTTCAYEIDSDLAQINTAWVASAGQTAAIYGFQHDPVGRITNLNINRPDLERRRQSAQPGLDHL